MTAVTTRKKRLYPRSHASLRAAATIAGLTACAGFADAQTNLLDVDLETLLNMEFRSAAGLTTMDARHMPVALTEIDHRSIETSGARDLNHLLELHVPNAQFILHHHLQPHLGFRGIISDREDKYLYQVNGRTMNNRMLLGADNERGLPLLGDMASINVVRGPASATHGAGALAGVINVQTHTGSSYRGSDLTARQGLVDSYSTAELRVGQALGEEAGLFVYYGVAKERGADGDYYIGRSFPATNGLPANIAGKPAAVPMARLGEPGFDELHHKFHASYVNGPFEVWARFVRDGGQDRPMREIYTSEIPADRTLAEWTRGRQFRSDQSTVTATFRQELAPAWNLEVVQSFDSWSFKDQRAGVYPERPTRHAREDEYFSRVIAVWTPDERHSVGFGADFSREWFKDPPYSDTLDRDPPLTEREWTTNRISFLGEHQWKLSDQWTTFFSLRTDKHTFSETLVSPRATVVFAPDEKNTFKIMAGQSVRRGGDEELWAEYQRNGTIPDPESLRSYEFSYARQLSDALSVNGSVHYQDYDAIGWSAPLFYSLSIGEYQIAGLDLELVYRREGIRWSASHGVAKLVGTDIPAGLPIGGQGITAEPYGFGNDLAEWSPHITKVALAQDFNTRWTVNASLVWYHGFPGARDYADFVNTLPAATSAMPWSDPDYNEPYGANLFLNAGLEYRLSERLTMRLDGTNLTSLFDATLAKRNYYFRLSEFSVEPSALTLTARYGF